MKPKLLAVLLISALLLFAGSNVQAQRKHDVDIEIVGVVPSTDSLILNPAGDVPVYAGKKVRWFIGPNASDVKSFEIEKKEVEGSTQIFYFFDKPPGSRTRNGGGTIDVLRGKKTYIYSIIWYDSAGNPHTFDPKITIDPTKLTLFEILMVILVGIVPILGIGLLFRRMSRIKARKNAKNP